MLSRQKLPLLTDQLGTQASLPWVTGTIMLLLGRILKFAPVSQLCCWNNRWSGRSELYPGYDQGRHTLGLRERALGAPLSCTESTITILHRLNQSSYRIFIYQAEHAPKPILLNTGEYYIPFQWHPVHVDSQVSCRRRHHSPHIRFDFPMEKWMNQNQVPYSRCSVLANF